MRSPIKSNQIDMLHGRLLGKLVLFALPLALSSILQQLFNAVDIAVLGQFAASQDQAAVGCTSAVINMFLNLFLGISVGANVVIATYLGQRADERVHTAVHTAMLVALVSGFVLMGVGLVTAKPILELIQTPDAVLDKAVLYLSIYFLGMPFIMVYNFGAAILRSIGDTNRPLICLTVSGVLNAGLNVFLVAVCGMDVDGVAIATVISNVVSCIVVVWMLCREKGVIHLSLRELRLDRELLGRMLAIGLPAGLQSTVFTFSNVCIQSTLNSFGTDAVAGSAAALNYEFFSYFPVVAFGQAAVTFCSQNFGARQYDRCRKVFRDTLLLSLACAEVMGLTFVFGRTLFVRFFTADPGVAEYAYLRICTLLPFYFLVPFYEIGGAALRGIGHSLAPALLTVAGTCVLRLIWVFTVCPRWPDYRVLMVVYPITWALTSIAIMICWFHYDRKLVKKFRAGQTA